VELELLRFENKFQFEIIFESDIDVNDVQVPPLIFQPIIENAIWHGLLPLNNQRIGKLFINVKQENGYLHIYIEDNGVGRQFKKDNIGNLRESKGIEITKQRILNLNSLSDQKLSNLIYEDVLDEHDHVVGTQVLLILPILNTFDNEFN